jgi:hypothetical protein
VPHGQRILVFGLGFCLPTGSHGLLCVRTASLTMARWVIPTID